MTHSRTLVATALLAVGALPAAARHSPAMFDMTKEVVLDGVVTEVSWGNPHVYFALRNPSRSSMPFDSTAFSTCVESLRLRHRQKRSFIAALARLRS